MFKNEGIDRKRRACTHFVDMADVSFDREKALPLRHILGVTTDQFHHPVRSVAEDM